MYDTLILNKKNNGVCELILNRPEAINALNDQMLVDLQTALDDLIWDESVKVVLLRGEGKGFCSGGDVKEMPLERNAYGWYSYMNARVNRLAQTFINFPKPLIAAVHGPCVGAGFNMALACDMILASRSAYFSEIFVNIGLKPDFGGLYSLTRHVKSLSSAKDLVFTGRKVFAEEGMNLAFVNRIFEDESFIEDTRSFVVELANGATLAMQMAKAVLNRSSHLDLDTVLQFEALTHGFVKQSEDHKEGVMAFREKRKPKFSGK